MPPKCPINQEDTNRQFIGAIAKLETTSEGIKMEIDEMKDSFKSLVEEINSIKKVLFFIMIGLVANIDPTHWIALFTKLNH